MDDFLSKMENFDIQIEKTFKFEEYEKLDSKFKSNNNIIEFKN